MTQRGTPDSVARRPPGWQGPRASSRRRASQSPDRVIPGYR
jgi:hypothetical protein